MIVIFSLSFSPPSVYSIKQRDFSSEAKDSNKKIDEATTRKMTTQQPKKKIDGVGPMTNEGMPVSLRSVIS